MNGVSKHPMGKSAKCRWQAQCDQILVICCAKPRLNSVGIVMLPVFYVAQHLETGRLVRLLADYTSWPTRDIHAVIQPNRHQPARLRLFMDRLIADSKTLPWERAGE